jgi:hypothetical protein
MCLTGRRICLINTEIRLRMPVPVNSAAFSFRFTALPLFLLLLSLLVWPGKVSAQNFQAALDNPDLTFTAAPGTWAEIPASGVYGSSYLRSIANPSAAVQLATSVNGPGYIVFWAVRYSGYTQSELLINGAAAATVDAYSNTWRQYVAPLAAGVNSIVWRIPASTSHQIDYVRVHSSSAATLEQVLPGTVWSTGGAAAWTGSLFPATHYSGRAVVSIPYASGEQTAWIEAPFNGPGLLTWKCSASTQLLVNGIPQFTHYETAPGRCVLPPGMNTVRWQRVRPAWAGVTYPNFEAWLENVFFVPGVTRSLSESVFGPGATGSAALTFTTGGDAPFFGMALLGSDGVLSGAYAYSGILPAGGTSWIETTLTGPGDLVPGNFPGVIPAVSSISMDGVPLSLYGNNRIPPGQHVIRWQYSRPADQLFPYDYTPVNGWQGCLRFAPWQPLQTVPFSAALEEPPGMSFSTATPEYVYGRTSLQPQGDDTVIIESGFMLTATLTGPGRLTWSGITLQDCMLDGLTLLAVPYPGNSLNANLDIPPGAHTLYFPGPCRINSMQFTPAVEVSPATVLAGGPLWQLSPEVSAWNAYNGVVGFFLPMWGTQNRPYGMTTTLTGPGIYTVKYQQRRTGSTAVFKLGGAELPLPSGLSTTAWTTASIPVPAGTHSFSITAPDGVYPATSHPLYTLFDDLSWVQQQGTSLGEATDAPELTWTTGGSVPWGGVISAVGSDAARVSGIPFAGSSWLETTVTGPGLLRFRQDSRYPENPGAGQQYNYEFTFSINGVAQSVTSGVAVLRELPPGPVTLRWQATLPSGAPASSQERATLDEVSWVPYLQQPLNTWSPPAGFNFTASPHEWAAVTTPDGDSGGSLHPLSVPPNTQAWIETTVTGPAALEYSYYSPASGDYTCPVLTVDGGARTLSAGTLPGGRWIDYRIFVPDGLHTVRWTLNAYYPLVFLDKLRLLPASANLVSGADLVGASWTPEAGQVWFTLLDATLPDGDVLTCESIWTTPQLSLPVQGPANLRLYSRHSSDLRLSPFRRTITPGPDGWFLHTLEVPPGSHSLSIYKYSSAQPPGPPVIDRVSIEALPVVPLANVFPLPGAVWSTSPANPFTGVTGSAWGNYLHASTGAGTPPAWVEVSITGPGKLSFRPDQSLPMINLWYSSEPFALNVSVNGLTLPGLSDGSSGLFVENESQPVDLYLPEGPQTVRWTLPVQNSPWYGGVIRAGLHLRDLVFTPASPLLPPSAGAQRAFLAKAGVHVEMDAGTGKPVIHATHSGGNYENDYPFLTWINASPGTLRFRWRKVSGFSPGLGARFHAWQMTSLPLPAAPWPEWVGYGPGGTFYLANNSDWQETELLLPYAGAACWWDFRGVLGALEVADITFEPAVPVSLAEALAIPITTVVTNPEYPWVGLRLADGRTVVCPYSSGDYSKGCDRPVM